MWVIVRSQMQIYKSAWNEKALESELRGVAEKIDKKISFELVMLSDFVAASEAEF